MKAAPFEYSRAADIDEACAMLAADENARVIAGGQTLVPMMAMRLARPTRLIDINRIAALSYIRDDGDGVAIGATTRQCVVERDALIARASCRCWRARSPSSAMPPRARAAPSAARSPMPIRRRKWRWSRSRSMRCLSYRAGGKTAEIPAREFYIGPMITALPAGACLTGVRFPVWHGQRSASAFTR